MFDSGIFEDHGFDLRNAIRERQKTIVDMTCVCVAYNGFTEMLDGIMQK